MVNRYLKNVGLLFAIFIHSNLALNDTEKPPSESFVVSANYGVSELTKPSNSVQNEENTEQFLPSNNFQQYEGDTENSLFVNKNYQDYSKSYLPATHEQNEGHLENAQHAHNQNEAYLESYPKSAVSNYQEDSEIPAASEWKANFDSSPCKKYEEVSQSNTDNFAPKSYYYGSYAGQPESTTASIQPFQEHQGNYFKEALNRNEVVDPLPISTYQSYSPKLSYDAQNIYNSNGYHGQRNNFENVVYGSQNSNGDDSQWIGTNRKILNDRADESQKDWTTGNQRTEHINDSHKPNVLELQEMINKIMKGNSKVHQVLKVPAVYEIHLQEEEKAFGHAPIEHNDHLKEIAAEKRHPQSSSAHNWRKKRPPSKPRRTRIPQFSRGGPSATKTWNLPAKINYFDSRDSLSADSYNSYGKYAYPKPFSSSGTGKEIPLQQWYHSPRSTNNQNQNSERIVPTGAPIYGTVNVPMTPGSTEVTFLDHGGNFDHQTKFDTSLLDSPEVRPDLSNYYAKKKEVENSSLFQGSGHENTYRGNSIGETRRNFRRNYRTPLRNREERNFFPFGNLNYIIYVREKSRG